MYNYLKIAILVNLGGADRATVENVFFCLVEAENLIRSTSCMVDGSVIECQLRDASRAMDRAAQHLWGSSPPRGVTVDDSGHYSVY